MKYFLTVISELLRVFGALWLIVEATNHFVNEQVSKDIREFWWLFLIVGLTIAIFRLWPQRRFQFIVKDRDIIVEVVIGDIFKEKGPIIVGSNTDFVTSFDVISPTSIQGLFSKKHFPSTKQINDQVKAQVPSTPCEFGTTITIQGLEKTAYFCAVAELNNSGVAKSSLEKLRISFGELWNYLSENAEKDILNVPVIGSGYSRVSAKREDLVKELVLSFLAAISQNSFCDRIRIVGSLKNNL